jgi:hypothetical protein
MQLAANRVVTREEDMAYSLMGIFHISISTAYGEGADRAFFRLLKEILNSYAGKVLDIFNWAGALPDLRPHNSLMLPRSPRNYRSRSCNTDLLLTEPMEPLTLTHMGLLIPVILMPAISIRDKSVQHDSIGDFNAVVDISPARNYDDFPTTYNVLDKRISGRDGQNKDNDWYQITLAVFNFYGNETHVFIPKTCIARGMEFAEPAGKVTALGYGVTIATNEPIVFDLRKLAILEGNDSDEATTNVLDDFVGWNKEMCYQSKKGDLTEHGMQLVSLYL